MMICRVTYEMTPPATYLVTYKQVCSSNANCVRQYFRQKWLHLTIFVILLRNIDMTDSSNWTALIARLARTPHTQYVAHISRHVSVAMIAWWRYILDIYIDQKQHYDIHTYMYNDKRTFAHLIIFYSFFSPAHLFTCLPVCVYICLQFVFFLFRILFESSYSSSLFPSPTLCCTEFTRAGTGIVTK